MSDVASLSYWQYCGPYVVLPHSTSPGVEAVNDASEAGDAPRGTAGMRSTHLTNIRSRTQTRSHAYTHTSNVRQVKQLAIFGVGNIDLDFTYLSASGFASSWTYREQKGARFQHAQQAFRSLVSPHSATTNEAYDSGPSGRALSQVMPFACPIARPVMILILTASLLLTASLKIHSQRACYRRRGR